MAGRPVTLQKESKHNNLTGFFKYVVTFFAVCLSSFHVYTALFGSFPALKQRPIHLFFGLPIILLLYPFRKKNKDKTTIVDIALVLLSIASIGWIIIDYGRISTRMSLLSPVLPVDMFLGVVLIVLIIDAVRRTVGWPMASLGILALFYAYFGPYMPGDLMHRGLPFHRIVDVMYLEVQGIWGPPLGVIASFVFLFILFGSFLEYSGAGNFYIDLAYSLTGRSAGGPAKAAVVSSGFMGSISGSAVANVVTTGTFSIPLMKRTGYPPHYAAAVEAAASAGGQLMPPVMGAGAFLIAEFVGVTYFEVVKVSVIPAILYFFSVYCYVDLQARKLGLQGLSAEEVKSFGRVMKAGWYHLVPILVLIYFLVGGYSTMRAGISGIISCFIISVVVSLKHKKEKSWPVFIKTLALDLIAIMERGARNALPVIGACACAGIIVGVVVMSGIAMVFSSLLISVSQGILFVAIILIGIASLVLGMGLPTTSAYILLAVLAAPALGELGVPVLTGHLIVFWLSQDTHITPPVCIATYTAAGIARSDPLKTALTAFKVAKGMYVLPFLYAYTPILLNGKPMEIVDTVIFTAIGLMTVAISLEAYSYKPMNIVQRIILFAGALLMFYPNFYTHITGLAVFLIVVVIPGLLSKFRRAGDAGGAGVVSR